MSKRPQALYHETQSLRRWPVGLLLALPPAALIFITCRQIIFHHPWGNPPATNGGLLFLTILLTAVYARLMTVRLVTDLFSERLEVGLRGLWPKRKIPLETIRGAKPVEYDPVADSGGYGIRTGRLGQSYTARGTRGVHLELADGHKILIGSQNADALAQKIQELRAGVAQ
jgi:hypothetical protein